MYPTDATLSRGSSVVLPPRLGGAYGCSHRSGSTIRSLFVGGGPGGSTPNLRSASTTAGSIPALVRMSSMSRPINSDGVLIPRLRAAQLIGSLPTKLR